MRIVVVGKTAQCLAVSSTVVAAVALQDPEAEARCNAVYQEGMVAVIVPPAVVGVPFAVWVTDSEVPCTRKLKQSVLLLQLLVLLVSLVDVQPRCDIVVGQG